ncbi:MAG: hypothetical protein NWF14_03440 [Candidatus Bathyarchaeota archaeon]|nr:hypothetical protein [Candidatus Bathyarchaeota archaeon]
MTARSKGLIQGKWVPKARKKVYRITEKGRAVFRESVARHFKLASSIRGWFFKELSDLTIMEDTDLPALMEPTARVLLLKEDASVEERIEALCKLRERLQRFNFMFSRMIDQIDLREKKLKTTREPIRTRKANG